MPADTRYVLGAKCTWHGPIDKIGRREMSPMRNTTLGEIPAFSLPCCPHCQGMLYEYPNVESWNGMVAAFNKNHPGYAELMAWQAENPCHKNLTALIDAYNAATGKEYKL